MFLQFLELPLVLLAHALRIRAQGIPHAPLAFVDLGLDLRGRQVIGPVRLRDPGLALDVLQHQRRFAPRRPAFHLFIHRKAHRVVLSNMVPERAFKGSFVTSVLHGSCTFDKKRSCHSQWMWKVSNCEFYALNL